jgi:predicted DNA-binding protein
MKTVSTKLDSRLHDRFIEMCNQDGKCQSEFLRDVIESICDDLEEDKPIQEAHYVPNPTVTIVDV